MSAKPLRYASQKRFAKNVVKSDVRAPAAAARRLAALGVDDMPWLSPEGLALLADAPEVCGPSTYKKSRGWR